MEFWSLCKDGLMPVQAQLSGRKLYRTFCAAVRSCGCPYIRVQRDYRNFDDRRLRVFIAVCFDSVLPYNGKVLFRCWFRFKVYQER